MRRSNRLFFAVFLTWSLMICGLHADIPKERILCFGDSITQGTYIEGRYVSLNSWVNLLQERSGGVLECINAGRSGRQTIQKHELLPYLENHKDIDRVIFYLGVNDLHSFDDQVNETNLKGCITNTTWLINKTREAYGDRLKITILSPPGLYVDGVSPHFRNIGFTEKCQDLLLRLRPLYKELAVREKCSFIDLWGVVSPQNYSDGLHPDLKGQQQTADHIWNALVNKGGPVKVACIGDSITFGAGIQDRETNCYPAQLQILLGKEYQVRNFGVSARTCLLQGDYPYCNEKAYRDALAFNPNYVIIKLGTNDSKPHNWKHKDQYKTDMKALAQSFLDLPTKPKVFLSLPTPIASDRWGITQQVVSKEVIPMIQELAEEMKLPIIDFYSAVPAEKHLIPDGVHPNAEGAGLMSTLAYQHLRDRPYTRLKDADQPE